VKDISLKLIQKSLRLFKKENSNTVKIALLKFIYKVFKNGSEYLKKLDIDVKYFLNVLLNEIRYLKPKSNVRMIIWKILGRIIENFQDEVK